MNSPPLAFGPLDLTTRSFRALSTTATVVVPARADEAERILRTDIDAVDRACSRFRSDSELAHVHANAGSSVKVSSLLFEALDVAYSVAERTSGAVDPTVGLALEALGYDRDFAADRDAADRDGSSQSGPRIQAPPPRPPSERGADSQGRSPRPRVIG